MKGQFNAKFFTCICLSFCIFQVYATHQGQECQDVIVNNVVVQTGLCDCQRYYNAIKPILDRYKRPITVLDLGAGQGYFTFRIAKDYDSTCIMVEDNSDSSQRADQLLELCHLNSNLKNIVLLNKKLSLKELKKLGDCEHFDVVLAFDYINPKDCEWNQTVNEILRLGDNIFIQTPWSNVSSENATQKNVVEYLVKQAGKLILQTPRTYEPKIEEQMFWFKRKKEKLRCKCFAWRSKDAYMDLFHIESSYTHKILLKKGKTSGPEWKKGINLVTFLMLNGTYPAKHDIKQTVANLIDKKLTDFTPWNLVIQGDNIELIDQRDKGYHVDIRRSLKFINKTIDQSSPQGISHLFKKFPNWKARKHTKNWLLRLF